MLPAGRCEWQRRLWREGKLNAKRQARLAEVGFVWRPSDAAWERHFAELRALRERRGHCQIPVAEGARPHSLKLWGSYQRRLWRGGRLLPHREQKLRSIGFDLERQAKGHDVS